MRSATDMSHLLGWNRDLLTCSHATAPAQPTGVFNAFFQCIPNRVHWHGNSMSLLPY